MKIFIDTKTGTWGDLKDLRVLPITQRKADEIEEMADSEIIELGKRRGKPVQ
jgi:hypothetical protein